VYPRVPWQLGTLSSPGSPGVRLNPSHPVASGRLILEGTPGLTHADGDSPGVKDSVKPDCPAPADDAWQDLMNLLAGLLHVLFGLV
jgi:hypothetical protein